MQTAKGCVVCTLNVLQLHTIMYPGLSIMYILSIKSNCYAVPYGYDNILSHVCQEIGKRRSNKNMSEKRVNKVYNDHFKIPSVCHKCPLDTQQNGKMRITKVMEK